MSFVDFKATAIGIAALDFMLPWAYNALSITLENFIVIVRDGELRDLFVRPRVVGAGADVATITVRVNGVSTALLVNHTENQASSQNNTDVVPVVAGDLVSILVDSVASVSGTDYDVIVDYNIS